MNAQAHGQAFENLIEYTNAVYARRGQALINKRPVPVTITNRKPGRITGHLAAKSTLDFDGVVKGRSVQFECKSTKQKSFPIRNFEVHQIDYMRACISHKVIVFALIHFEDFNETYFVPAHIIIDAWDNMQRMKEARKSIARETFETSPHIVKLGATNGVPVDYLPVVELLL